MPLCRAGPPAERGGSLHCWEACTSGCVVGEQQEPAVWPLGCAHHEPHLGPLLLWGLGLWEGDPGLGPNSVQGGDLGWGCLGEGAVGGGRPEGEVGRRPAAGLRWAARGVSSLACCCSGSGFGGPGSQPDPARVRGRAGWPCGSLLPSASKLCHCRPWPAWTPGAQAERCQEQGRGCSDQDSGAWGPVPSPVPSLIPTRTHFGANLECVLPKERQQLEGPLWGPARVSRRHPSAPGWATGG